MHADRPDLLENGVLIWHHNARPHLGKDVILLEFREHLPTAFLTGRLHKRRNDARWVPHDLSEEQSVDVWKFHNNCCTDCVKKGMNFCKRWLLLTKPGSGISSLN